MKLVPNSTLLMKSFCLHVITFKLISFRHYTPLCMGFLGFQASPAVIL